MSFADTIVAVSTPPGVGAISIIRLSGATACQIVERLFKPSRKEAGNTWLKTHKATHGYLEDKEACERIDEVVVTAFLEPHSYTGEDLLEISCHGSPVVTRKILELCLKLDARLAKPGEFTERAYLAGKIDLTQAEAVLDLIQAKTSYQSKLALSALSGELGRQIKAIRQGLIQLLTTIVAGIDFPEEVGEMPEPDIEKIVTESILQLNKLAKTASSGKFLREGLRIAIVGRPNAGKSSLLNHLLKYERAIVTDIAGTTRDALEEFLDINGIPVILVDTAGIRHTEDQVEKIGIERSKRAIEDSHLVLLLVDITAGWGEQEVHIAELIGQKPVILLKNKIDLGVVPEIENNLNPVAELLISAKTGSGIEELGQAIELWVFAGGNLSDTGASLNARQAELCQKALAGLNLVQQTVANGMPQDCLASDLKITIDALSEICGEMVTEEVISSVFANFCIGK